MKGRPAMTNSTFQPDFVSYHKSVTEELFSVKNRIRNLARHWQADGEYKEAALRAILRRHLPTSFEVARGFVVGKEDSSTQIDILIIDLSKPILFRDGDLMIVTPDTVKAIIEVKTRLAAPKLISEAVAKLLVNADLCGHEGHVPWTGLFIYDDSDFADEALLTAVWNGTKSAFNPLNCLSMGKDRLMKFLPPPTSCWRTYDLPGYAPSSFLAQVILSVSGAMPEMTGYAWGTSENENQRGKHEIRRIDGQIADCTRSVKRE